MLLALVVVDLLRRLAPGCSPMVALFGYRAHAVASVARKASLSYTGEVREASSLSLENVSLSCCLDLVWNAVRRQSQIFFSSLHGFARHLCCCSSFEGVVPV